MRPRLSVALAFVFCSLSSLLGCISTVFRPGADRLQLHFPPVEPSSVLVLSHPPSGPFTTLGEIEAYTSGYFSDESVIRRIVMTAAQKGANAIVFIRDSSMMAAVGDEDPDSAYRKRASLVYKAIRVPDPPSP